jgi:S-adenosylmethionine-diacylglycerol 3-amino-3-carboxypropyl transferase
VSESDENKTAKTESMKQETRAMLDQAVRNTTDKGKRDIWDRLFVKAFEGLVYPQIWEDPEADMLALNLDEKSRVISIASGGCNMMAYLSRAPEKIDVVDLNRHHVALNELKLAAVQNLPSYEMFFDFFGKANLRENVERYDHYIAEHLDLQTRSYWSGKKIPAIRRIKGFQNGFYRFGLLGRLIRLVHTVGKSYGKNPRKSFEKILSAQDRDERERIFEEDIGILFSKKFVTWVSKIPAMLYGLGIPPAQYEALVRAGNGDITKTLYDRVKHLALGFPPEENYFAWQAFTLSYDTEHRKAIATYLKPELYETIKANAYKVDVHHRNVIDFLRSLPDNDRSAFLFLDAQDWMTPEVLSELWTEVTRVARPDARVVFRTADYTSPLEQALPAHIRKCWVYDQELSQKVTEADRSAIYGASHVYILKESS